MGANALITAGECICIDEYFNKTIISLNRRRMIFPFTLITSTFSDSILCWNASSLFPNDNTETSSPLSFCLDTKFFTHFSAPPTCRLLTQWIILIFKISWHNRTSASNRLHSFQVQLGNDVNHKVKKKGVDLCLVEN